MKKLKIPLTIPSVDIALYRGDHRSIPLRLTGKDNQPLDLRQAALFLHAKSEESEAPVLALSTQNGNIEAENGRLVLHFDSALTATATWQTADYDLEWRQGSQVKTLFKGKIRLEHDITWEA